MTLKTVSMRFREDEFEDLETIVESEGYHSKAEFIRDLIRKYYDEWAEKVIKHAREHPEEYISLEQLKKDYEERED